MLDRTTKLRPVGQRRARVSGWMAQCREEAVRRARGRCGFCSLPESGLEWSGLEWHHIFGRALGIRGAAKWAHVPELTSMICHTCHRRWHDGAEVEDEAWREHFRRRALTLLCLRYFGLGVELPASVRAAVAALVAQGKEPVL